MNSATDLNEYRRRRNLKRLKEDVDKSSHLSDMGLKRESDKHLEDKAKLKQYISIMRIAVMAAEKKSGVIYVECIDEGDAVFRDESGEILDYEKDFGHLYEHTYEKEDLIIVSLINYAPSKIILQNSGSWNEYFLYTLTEIFEGVLEIED